MRKEILVAEIIFPYRPNSDRVSVGGQLCLVRRGRFAMHHEFRVTPVIYAGRTALEWQVSFMVEILTLPDGRTGKGLGRSRITLATIKAVVEVFINLELYLTHGSPVDLIFNRPDEPDLLALGNPDNGLAVAFRDHQR